MEWDGYSRKQKICHCESSLNQIGPLGNFLAQKGGMSMLKLDIHVEHESKFDFRILGKILHLALEIAHRIKR